MKKYSITCLIIIVIVLIIVYILNTSKIKNEGEKITMEYEFDSMIGLEKLDLYYEAHLVDLDGECFIYNIYFKDKIDDEKLEEIKNSVKEFSENYNYNGDTYPGYIDISKKDNNIVIFLDVGNVLPQNQNISIQEILIAINTVNGIEKVMINEF